MFVYLVCATKEMFYFESFRNRVSTRLKRTIYHWRKKWGGRGRHERVEPSADLSHKGDQNI